MVAVAQAAAGLHHGLVDGHVGDALLGYAMVFFAIWWAWMNFTWFASAYDTDDVPYRLAVFVQMAGVLVMAAGIPRAFDDRDFAVMTLGYVVMRVALVALWLRAARSDPASAGTAPALRARHHASCQVGWVLAAAPARGAVRARASSCCAAAELAVPVWAERGRPRRPGTRTTSPSATACSRSSCSASRCWRPRSPSRPPSTPASTFGDLVAVVVGGLLIVFSMWWIYFDLPSERMVGRARREFERAVRRRSSGATGTTWSSAPCAAAGAGLAVPSTR